MNILSLFQTSPSLALIFLLAIVAAITVHEFAHAWTADRLGDDTPRLQGRVTLNPLAHLDPIGSLCFVLFGFGWGKPVMYNPMRLHRRVDELLIALAGPASNLVFALLINLVIAGLGTHFSSLVQSLQLATEINLILAAFNLVPIPPLDGSSIVAYFWPPYRSAMSGNIGIILLLLVLFVSIPGVGNILTLVVQPIESFFFALTHLFGIIPS